MLSFFAKASVMVFAGVVAVLMVVLLGIAVSTIWGVAGTFDTWPVWLLTVCRVFLTVLVVDFVPAGLSVIYLLDSNE